MSKKYAYMHWVKYTILDYSALYGYHKGPPHMAVSQKCGMETKCMPYGNDSGDHYKLLGETVTTFLVFLLSCNYCNARK